jgi:hypothetical protein
LCGTKESANVVGRIILHNQNGITHYEWEDPVAVAPATIPLAVVRRKRAQKSNDVNEPRRSPDRRGGNSPQPRQRGVIIDGVYHPPPGFII